ncbi:MAG: integrin alpha [Planctomycetota bacterium]
MESTEEKLHHLNDLIVQRLNNGPGQFRFDVVDPTNGALIAQVPDAILPSGITFQVVRFDFLDDLDGDGRKEWIVGNPAHNNEGVVAIMSPTTGVVLEHWLGGGFGRAFGGQVVSLDDIDGDGLRDFAFYEYYELGPVNPPLSGAIEVWGSSGGRHMDHLLLPPVNQVVQPTLRRLGDVDQDGVNELGFNFFSGDVNIVSPVTGQTIGVIPSPIGPNIGFGFDIQSGGDFDGDGVSDIFIGAPGFLLGSFQVGAVYVYSGSDFSLVGLDHGLLAFGGFGVTLTVHEDVTGDGLADFVVACGCTLQVGGIVTAYYGSAEFDDTYRSGTVIASDGSVGVDVLGFTEFGIAASNFGGESRSVIVPQGVFSTVWLAKPPTAMGLSRHAIFGRIGPELILDSFTLPAGLGEFAFGPPGLSSDPKVVTLTDAFTPSAGLLPSNLAPAAPGAPICVLPNNLPAGFVFTLQGIVEDPSSQTFGLSITNSIRVVIRP